MRLFWMDMWMGWASDIPNKPGRIRGRAISLNFNYSGAQPLHCISSYEIVRHAKSLSCGDRSEWR